MAVRWRRLAIRPRALFLLFGKSFDSRQWTSLHGEIVNRARSRGWREHLVQRQRFSGGCLDILISAQRVPSRELVDPSHLQDHGVAVLRSDDDQSASINDLKLDLASNSKRRNPCDPYLIRCDRVTTNRPWTVAVERIIRAQATIIACQDGSSIVGRVALRVIPYRTMQVTAIESKRNRSVETVVLANGRRLISRIRIISLVSFLF